jgi:uncharacterized oxidoreductase
MPTLPATQLEQLTVTIFERLGAPRENAATVAKHLVEANLAGHDSHGVIRVPQYFELIREGKLKPAGTMQVTREMGSAAMVDGSAGFGQVIGRDAMLLAIKIAQSGAIGAVTVRNCHHTGRIGTYTQMAAEAGLVGLAMVNSGGGGQAVAPFGGTGRRLSTNPISIAAPTGGPFPVVLDMASSIAPEGKVRTYYQAGKQLPAGWTIDAEGNPTTDPNHFYGTPSGALLPLGGSAGHKGFALGFMIDVLAGALTGAGSCQPGPTTPGDGMLAIAIDVRQFGPLAAFQDRVAQLSAHVKSSPTAAGVERIYVPGEVEAVRREQRLREGIAVEPSLWKQIEAICRGLEIDLSALGQS